MPNSFTAWTAYGLGGWPSIAPRPAETTRKSPRPRTAARKMPSAIGLRQTLPVQIKRTVFISGGGQRRLQQRRQRKRSSNPLRLGPSSRHSRAPGTAVPQCARRRQSALECAREKSAPTYVGGYRSVEISGAKLFSSILQLGAVKFYEWARRTIANPFSTSNARASAGSWTIGPSASTSRLNDRSASGVSPSFRSRTSSASLSRGRRLVRVIPLAAFVRERVWLASILPRGTTRKASA